MKISNTYIASSQIRDKVVRWKNADTRIAFEGGKD